MSDERWTWRYDHELPTQTGAGNGFVEELLRRLEENHWEQHDIFSIQLAMEEALVNAIKHGNRMDAAKKVYVRCGMNSDLLRVEVEDEGEGFDPSQVPDPTDPDQIENPHGRGILLMRTFMSRVEYNETGNRVLLEKRRSKADEAGAT